MFDLTKATRTLLCYINAVVPWNATFYNFIFENSYPPSFGFAMVFTDTSRDIIIILRMDIRAWNVKEWNVLKSLAVTTFCKKEKKESSDLWVLLSFLQILAKLANLNNVQMWIDCVWDKDKHSFDTKCHYLVCSMTYMQFTT